MKLKTISVYASVALATSVLLTACGGGGGGASGSNTTTYTGTVDLAPVYNMLVYTGSRYGNESNLPTNHTFTDVNGSYSLVATQGSTVKIEPIYGTTKVIASDDDIVAPLSAANFTDKYFKATTTSTDAYINMDDTKKESVKNLNTNQLYSLFRATDEDNITTKMTFDINTTLKTAQNLAFKEARDAQDFAMKELFREYILESNNTIYGDVIETTTQVEALDKLLTGYIMASWLEISTDKNITINDKNTISSVASSVISKYNSQEGLATNRQISSSPAVDVELQDYSIYALQAIGNKILNNTDTNATVVYQDSKKVFAGVSSKFGATLKETAITIDQNITKSQANKTLAPLLFNAYVDGFVN